MSLNEAMKKNGAAFAIRSCGRYGLMIALGYLILALIHWRNSWDYVSQGYPFPDLGGSRKASPTLEVGQTAAICWLYGLYLLPLLSWERRKFSVREIVAIG